MSTAAACHASQLSVGGFGITGVSFTGVITIRIENTSSSPCSLRGYPVVTFLGNARSRFALPLILPTCCESPKATLASSEL